MRLLVSPGRNDSFLDTQVVLLFCPLQLGNWLKLRNTMFYTVIELKHMHTLVMYNCMTCLVFEHLAMLGSKDMLKVM